MDSAVDFERERWVLSCNPAYLVSDLGRVRNARTGWLVTPWKHQSGHLYVEAGQVHRLVLESFHGPAHDGRECCHIDGDPANNKLGNLRWGTRVDNINDWCRANNRPIRGLLTYDQAEEVRAKYDGKRGSIERLAREYGTKRWSIESALRGGYRRPA